MAKQKNRTTRSDQPRENVPELEHFVENALKAGCRWKAEFRGLWNYNSVDKRFVPYQHGQRSLRTRLGQYQVHVGYLSHLTCGSNYRPIEIYYATVQKEGTAIAHVNDGSSDDGSISEKFSKLRDLYQRVAAACKPLKWVPR